MFLCSSCHARSTCRATVHLTITREKCSGCGFVSGCFDCGAVIVQRRVAPKYATIEAYRNVHQLSYRKIRM